MLDRLFPWHLRKKQTEPKTRVPDENLDGFTDVAKSLWQKAEQKTINTMVYLREYVDFSQESKAFIGPYLRLMYVSESITNRQIDHNYHYWFKGPDLKAVQERTIAIVQKRANSWLVDDAQVQAKVIKNAREIARKIANLGNINKANLILTLGTMPQDLHSYISQNRRATQG